MSQTKQQIQALLAEAASSPRHRFGQNFMIDRNLVGVIADSGQLQKSDLAIEVGPGTGTLTEELLVRAGEVLAVEIDRDLAALLRRYFAAKSNFRLLEGDALAGKHRLNPELEAVIIEAKRQGRPVKLVANLPYNIASPLVIELLICGVEHLAFTVQKEVAFRLKAQAGSDDYGPLTVMAQLLAEVRVDRILPAQAFWPAPKIESALVLMKRNDRLGEDARPFGQFVQTLFASRRKMLRKALQQAGYEDAEGLLQSLAIDPQQRPEMLAPGELLRLYREMGGRPLE